MTKRQVIKAVLDGQKPPYVPWSFSFTQEAHEQRLVRHYGTDRMEPFLFNPFQPEVMDVATLIPQYRGRLTFHGGLSTQKTLPFGTPDDVRAETRKLISLGKDGGYILSPAHAVEGDVPLDNMLAFIDEALSQPGFSG